MKKLVRAVFRRRTKAKESAKAEDKGHLLEPSAG